MDEVGGLLSAREARVCGPGAQPAKEASRWVLSCPVPVLAAALVQFVRISQIL